MIEPQPVRIGDRTWPEVTGRPVMLVPLGATEQHGPHLPLSTDTIIAEVMATRAAAAVVAQGIDAVVAPALPYGSSGEHAGFAGTLSIGQAALELVVVELVRSIDPVDVGGIVLVNGHGGNFAPVSRAVRTLRFEGRTICAWWPTEPTGDAHAGITETSIMLHIAPDLVRTDRFEAGNSTSLAELLPIIEKRGLRAVTLNGVLGDPNGARATLGAELVNRWTAEIVVMIQSLIT